MCFVKKNNMFKGYKRGGLPSRFIIFFILVYRLELGGSISNVTTNLTTSYVFNIQIFSFKLTPIEQIIPKKLNTQKRLGGKYST